MRLTCPNCDAEYEVDASVIPDGGRDVQCSNCGHTWFQLSEHAEAEIEAEMAATAGARAPTPAPKRPEPKRPEVPPADTRSDSGAKTAAKGPTESVMEVLREEAAIEAAARKAEARPEVRLGIETQTEMGLQTSRPVDPVASRIARIQGVEPQLPPGKVQSKRDKLPEIDELNSSLRSRSDGRAGVTVADDEAAPNRRGGFGTGFMLMVILAAIMTAVYVMAPKIAEQIPGAKAALDGYVLTVDLARVKLDGWLQAAAAYLRGLISG